MEQRSVELLGHELRLQSMFCSVVSGESERRLKKVNTRIHGGITIYNDDDDDDSSSFLEYKIFTSFFKGSYLKLA